MPEPRLQTPRPRDRMQELWKERRTADWGRIKADAEINVIELGHADQKMREHARLELCTLHDRERFCVPAGEQTIVMRLLFDYMADAAKEAPKETMNGHNGTGEEFLARKFLLEASDIIKSYGGEPEIQRLGGMAKDAPLERRCELEDLRRWIARRLCKQGILELRALMKKFDVKADGNGSAEAMGSAAEGMVEVLVRVGRNSKLAGSESILGELEMISKMLPTEVEKANTAPVLAVLRQLHEVMASLTDPQARVIQNIP